ATALAPTATQAEVAAKMALLRGARWAMRRVDAAWESAYFGAAPSKKPLAADYPVGLLLTFGTGEIAYSRHFQAYLDAWATERTSPPAPFPAGRGGTKETKETIR
ncbi:MAG TPA: hypothetical protein VKQ36_00105, partial [Ktedonobacterales bacterium]|nr:hypothetical protein [Ktedonobacterales bacterium]